MWGRLEREQLAATQTESELELRGSDWTEECPVLLLSSQLKGTGRPAPPPAVEFVDHLPLETSEVNLQDQEDVRT